MAGLITTPSGLAATKGLSTPVWNPSRIAGCVGWWDMTDNMTMWRDTGAASAINATGQAIARVDDQSGNGKHLLQSTAGDRPTFQISSGRCWLEGNGTTNLMATSTALFSAAATQSRTIAAAFRQTAAATSPLVVASLSGGSYISIYPRFSGDGLYYSGNTGAVFNTAPGLTVGTDYALVDVTSAGGGNVARANGVQIMSEAALPATTNVGQAVILSNDVPPADIEWWTGRLYALAVFSVAVSGQDLTDLERWLAGKAGVTL